MPYPSFAEITRHLPSDLADICPIGVRDFRINPNKAEWLALTETLLKRGGVQGRLLRLWNSGIYQLREKITSFPEAAIYLELETIRDSIIIIEIHDHFSRSTVPRPFFDSFWRHSLTCAKYARAIAKKQGFPNPDKFLLAGLLHDIGRLVFAQIYPQISKTLVEYATAQRLLLHQAEKKLLGYDHQWIGESLLQSWQVEKGVIAAARFHHDPTPLRCVHHLAEAATIHVADHLANAFCPQNQALIPPLFLAALHQLPKSISPINDFINTANSESQNFEDCFLGGSASVIPE